MSGHAWRRTLRRVSLAAGAWAAYTPLAHGQGVAAPSLSRAESTESAAPAPPSVTADIIDTHGAAMRAYQAALDRQKLGASSPLSAPRIRDELGLIEEKLATGRRDEAISDLVYIVESTRFEPFKRSDDGRAATYWLGDALGRGGAYQPARGYLTSLLFAPPTDVWYRRAVHTLVDLALESDEPQLLLGDLQGVASGTSGASGASGASGGSEEVTGDVWYLSGRVAEREGRPRDALAAYGKVSEKSRFWAQATYLAGVLAVELREYKRGEALFCRVADPKQTPKKAALFGGQDFFRVRDLARLGLGRLAHEQYRFDDARYYYYLVPHDSDELPEALYETATTRYEAKDYQGARDSLEELKRLRVDNSYEDETYILDAYIDLATCRFAQADGKLDAFLRRYDPVRDAARHLLGDGAAMTALLQAVRTSADPASVGLGVRAETARALGALLRVDSGYGRAARRLADLDHQQNGLRRAMGELEQAMARLASPRALRPQTYLSRAQTEPDKLERIETQIGEIKRLLREAENASRAGANGELEGIRQELAALELRARAARASMPPASGNVAAQGQDLASLLTADREHANALYDDGQRMHVLLEQQERTLATDALLRLERRLSRLLRRARLGRIETVLGKKRALEVEVEALGQGLLPQSIVDSLDAARYLGDNEEYWPFEGEDWADEYVGGENLN